MNTQENEEVKVMDAGSRKEKSYNVSALLECKYLRSLQLLARGITHDYNNIFTGLAGQLGRLDKDTARTKDVGKKEQQVDTLVKRGARTTSIIYDFARLDPEKMAIYSAEVLLQRVVDALNCLSRLHRFKLDNGTRLPRIQCNFMDVFLMFFYLGENGMEAMPEGGDIVFTPKVVEEGFLSVSVSDSGHGVSPVLRNRIFEPLITTKEQQGTLGMGLYAAQMIAQKHKGTLTFSSTPGTGAVFKVRLPIESAASEQPNCHAGRKGEDSTTPKPEQRLVKQVFFVIENDEAFLQFIVSGLQHRGHLVFSAKSCGEAIEDFELIHEAVTILLLDIGLSDSDGFGCLEELRAINDQATVVFMSGDDADQITDTPVVSPFLKKPFTIKNIEDLVANAAATRQK